MAKTLKDFLNERQLGPMVVKNPDEQKFIDKHAIAKVADRNGNDDELFKGSKVKFADRKKDRKGYNPGEDEEVYEELKGNQHKIDANKNGKVDAQDFKLLRKKKVNEASYKDGDTRMGSVGPITTDAERADRAKKYREKMMKKEEAEQIDELSTPTLQSYRKKARAQGNAIVDKMKMGGGDWSKDQKDTKTLRKRAAGAQASGKQLIKRGESLKTEEVEQIDELDHKLGGTLSRYINKTKDDPKREAGRNLALKKRWGDAKYGTPEPKVKAAVREESEQIDELSKATLRSYAQNAKDQMSRSDTVAGREMGARNAGAKPSAKEKFHNRRADKRHAGLGLAIDKLAREEVEELDEILDTKKKQTEYKRAAKQSKQKYDDAWAYMVTPGARGSSTPPTPEHEKTIRRLIKMQSKRERGLDLLKRKQTKVKEEVEIEEKLSPKASMSTYIKDFQKSDAPQFKGKSKEKRRVMAIAAKLSAERGGKPLNKEERLIANLGDLAESHKRTLLNVFAKLNEDNQRKFMATCETPEGIEQMLNFAIQNRGE